MADRRFSNRPPSIDMREDLARRESQMRDRRYSDQLRDRIVDDYARIDRDEAMRTIINDPEIVLDAEMMEVINDPDVTVDRDLRPTRMTRTRRQDTRALGAQLSGAGFALPSARTRKKSKMDSKMSKSLKLANQKLRNKNGKLKKGKTMRDVMKMAHKLAKK